MSTACRLGRMTPNGFQAIFINSNGVRSYMEPMLSVFYSDPEKVNQLFNLGNLLSVRKEPMFKEPFLSKVRTLKSLVAFDSLHYLYDVCERCSDVGCSQEEVGNYSSPKDFIDEHNYFYDDKTHSWYVGERDKSDYWNKDKIKIVKCKASKEEAQKLLHSKRLLDLAAEGHYVLLKDELEMHVPVTCHYSKKAENARYYLTLGSKSCNPYYFKYDLEIPRQDTGKVILRCNSLEDLVKGALNVLWSL